MKHTRRIASLLLALVMVFAMATTAFADTAATTGTITITNAVEGATYTAVKLFDATVNGSNIAYTGTIPSALSTYFTADEAGNITVTDAGKDSTDSNKLSADAIAAIKTWAATQNSENATIHTASNSNGVATFSNLPFGYYVINDNVGTVVTVDSTNPTATIAAKNEAPTLDKKITNASSYDEDGKKALAQVGTSVNYEVTINVEAGATGYEFHDKMGTGLQYNNDVKVYVDSTEVDTGNYTKNTVEGETITIQFKDEWIKTVIDKTIVVKYSATITSDALQTTSAKNTAWLDYGNEHSTAKKETEVYNAKFTVTKKDGQGAPLAGAGFVIAKTVNEKNDDGTDKKGEDGNVITKTVYYKLANNVVTWVDSIDDATENKSDATGAVPAFTGLANGTYTLIEKTVPAGYNKAADQNFTIAEHDYTAGNLVQAATVVNQTGSELPSTGGMGTTLFYIVGGLMVAAAVVLLVTKKRMASAE